MHLFKKCNFDLKIRPLNDKNEDRIFNSNTSINILV